MSAAASPVSTAPTALIADDEPLLRDSLQRSLALLWPELRVVAQARNGREAVEMFELHRPDIAFLDVHMPGVNGMEAARQIARNGPGDPSPLESKALQLDETAGVLRRLIIQGARLLEQRGATAGDPPVEARKPSSG